MMFCPKCGAQLPDDASFCMKCGTRIGQAQSQQQAQAPSQNVVAPSGATSMKCPSCVKPGTLILGDNIPISEMKVGSQVIGVSGIEGVSETFIRSYTGNMMRIKAAGILPIELTPEHPVLTARRSTTSHRMGEPKFSTPTWRHAHDVKPYDWHKTNGDYLLLPVPTGQFDAKVLDLRQFTTSRGFNIAKAKGYPVTFPINSKTSWLFGVYVAEGFSDKKDVVFSIGRHEIELRDRIVSIGRTLGYSPFCTEKDTTVEVGIPSRILSRAFAFWCGTGASNKKIPDFILLNKDDSILMSFFSGYVKGDGHRSRKRGVMNAEVTTVSKILALQFQLLTARMGFHLAVQKIEGKGESIIMGRRVKVHEKFQIRGQIEQGKRQAIKSVGQFLYTPVRKVESFHYSGNVHNLATRDGTYLVSNAVVHNCGAPISPNFGEMFVTCQYCGSSVSLGNEGWKSINKHTMLPVKISQQDDAMKEIHDLMDKGFLHRHLQESSKLEEVNLAMVPYWLIPVSARTSLVAVDMAMEAGQIATTAALAGIMGGAIGGGRRGGFGGGGGLVTGMVLGTMMGGGGFAGGSQGNRKAYQMNNDYNFPIVGLKALTEYQPKDYQFNLNDRVLFDETKVKGMKVLNGDVGEEIAKNQAKTLVDQLQSDKAHKEHHMVQQISTESDIGEAELLHAPVWFARYDHKNGKIVLAIDGNSGGVINSIGL